jgi:putative acetyltransferase
MELKNMHIREAKDSDSTAIKVVVFSVLQEYGLSPDSTSTDKDLDTIEASYFLKGGYFGVVEENNSIIATFGLYRENATTCELRKMYCLPSSRGKGLGKNLLQFALEKAKELGFSRVVLETASPLKEAIGLYKKYGFVEFKPDHMSARCDQAYELFL